MNNLLGLNGLMSGIPIIVLPPVKKQRRTHKKKRINKKWAKRYGYIHYSTIKDGETLMMDGKMYMNQTTYSILKKSEIMKTL